MLGCLSLAAPQVLDENGEVKTKNDIRDITHLHHALDACVLALASHSRTATWELIVKRNPNGEEKRELMALGVIGFNAEGRFEMRDLDNRLKEQIRQRLAEKRVVQTYPGAIGRTLRSRTCGALSQSLTATRRFDSASVKRTARGY